MSRLELTPELRKALEGKETTVEDLVRCVAPRLHQVSPVAKAAEGNGKQQGHGSRPAMAAVGFVLGQRTTRTTKIEEDHPVDRKTGLPNPRCRRRAKSNGRRGWTATRAKRRLSGRNAFRSTSS